MRRIEIAQSVNAARIYQSRASFLENHFREREKSSRDGGHRLQSRTTGIPRAAVRDFLFMYMIHDHMAQLYSALGRIRVLGELLHVIKEPRRLADEEPHGGEECESAQWRRLPCSLVG